MAVRANLSECRRLPDHVWLECGLFIGLGGESDKKAADEQDEDTFSHVPVCMLQVLDHLAGEWSRFTSINQIAAACHDFVPHDLLAIAQLFDKVAQERGEVDLEIDKVLLQKQCHDFYRCKRYFEVDIRNVLINEA